MCVGKYKEWLTPDGLALVEGWARNGLTEDQISHNMGISPRTLAQWKHDHPQILQALKKGKEVVDILVENALLKRALGYEYNEVRVEECGVVKKVITTTKMVLPDTTAQIFWLKNRKPKDWRDKRDIDISTEENNANFGVVLLPERKPVTDEH